MKVTRIQNLVTVALACLVVFMTTNALAADPLSSWNDGAAKQSIVAFVAKVSKEGSPDFVPPEQRVVRLLTCEPPLHGEIRKRFVHAYGSVAADQLSGGVRVQHRRRQIQQGATWLRPTSPGQVRWP